MQTRSLLQAPCLKPVMGEGMPPDLAKSGPQNFLTNYCMGSNHPVTEEIGGRTLAFNFYGATRRFVCRRQAGRLVF